MSGTTLNVILQALHLLFAAFWLGSLLYTELILWPELRKIGQLATVQGPLRTAKVRKRIGIAIVGTLVTGYARGVSGGVFDRLFSPYGVLFLLAAIITIATTVWWLNFPTRDRKIGWRLFYSSFVVIFALMIALRFEAGR
jgi:uncharacterized membrane protein